MPEFVTICPIGPVKERIIEEIAASISSSLGLDCSVSREIKIPESAFSKTRTQYNSKLILKHLFKGFNPSVFRVLGVTEVDLYVPILKYVFGLAQINGPCSLISLYRLRPQIYDQPPDLEILLERAEKTALHELGHTLGLIHCRDRSCIMFSSTKIKDTDSKQRAFCPTCHALFRWYLEKMKRI
ncbi:MAG: archaemetzincin family Zn-dependent metalloprotease [Thermodesulfobacteriota bacterium]|nr:archaemetzincin family Zn-dependent metalloprotease [Thermodesulfobacteriota bacterium]